MFSQIVMTGGISFASQGKMFSPPEGFWKWKDDLVENKSEYTKAEWYDDWLQKVYARVNEARSIPDQVSAEYAVIKGLLADEQIQDTFFVKIIASDTVGGYMSCDLLQLLLEEEFGMNVSVAAEYVSIEVKDNVRLNQRLGNFLYTVNDALQYGNNQNTLFIPLGGYKVMTSFAVSIGHLNRIDSYYLHETSKELVKVPWLPVEIDTAFIEQNKSAVKRLNQGTVALHSLDSAEKEMIDQHPYLFELKEGSVSLNPFGKFFVLKEAFRYLYDTKLVVSDQVRKLLDGNFSWKKIVYKEAQRLMAELNSGETVWAHRHEKEFKELDQSRIRAHLLKSGRNSQIPVRFTYRFIEENDELVINHLWTNHQLYEREAAMGVGMYEWNPGKMDVTKEFYEVLK